MPSASEDEKASISSMAPWWREQAVLVSWLHIDPRRRDHQQAREVPAAGFASSASSIGLAKASPTMTTHVDPLPFDLVQQFDRVEVARRQGDDAPPGVRCAIETAAAPVPCISGQAGRVTARRRCRALRPARRRGRRRRWTAPSWRWRAPREVVLAPHHALGHAGGAAGVEHVEVVAVAAPGAAARAGAGDRRPRRRRPIRARAAAVVDPEPAATFGSAAADALDAFGEAGVEHHGLGVGVVPAGTAALRRRSGSWC